MNGANHRMNSVTTYPFNIMGGGWEQFAPALDDLPLKKGDTVVGNDVWIGQNVTVMPGGAYRGWRDHRRKLRRHEEHTGLLCRGREPVPCDTAEIRR